MTNARTLLESHDIARMGAAADEIRARRHPDNIVTYIIDRNINYTNVCNVVCTFCAFYRRPGAPDTYVRTFDEICEKIDETIALGGTGVLMQGGLHPDFGIEWYEDLLRSLHAKYPGFQLHCFSPPEIHNIHLISKLDYETIMARLKDGGTLQSARRRREILDDEVRKRVSTKCTTDEWLAVMRAVHRVGLAIDCDDDVWHRRQDRTSRQTSCSAFAICRMRPAASRRLFRGRSNARTPRSAAGSKTSRPASII